MIAKNADIMNGIIQRTLKEIYATFINYIIGNPPFVGHQWRPPVQVEDMMLAFPDYNKHGKLD